MMASEDSVLQPLNLNLAENANQQQRPKRSRKPNPRYIAEIGDATHEGSTRTNENYRRKRKVARLSARENASQRGIIDISQTKDIRFKEGRLVITGKRTYAAACSPESNGTMELVSDDGEYSLADLPKAMQSKVRRYQNKTNKSGAPLVCGDLGLQSSSSVIPSPGDEPRTKRQRTSTHSPLFSILDAIEKIEGGDVWTRLTAFTSEAPQPAEPLQPLQPLQPQQPRTRDVAASSAPKATHRPTKNAACQRTVGCDKGFRHTGFCRAHKVNCRENRLRRAQAKKHAE